LKKSYSNRNFSIGAGSAGAISAVFKPNQQPVDGKISLAHSKELDYYFTRTFKRSILLSQPFNTQHNSSRYHENHT